jgi:hypothetical protein
VNGVHAVFDSDRQRMDSQLLPFAFVTRRAPLTRYSLWARVSAQHRGTWKSGGWLKARLQSAGNVFIIGGRKCEPILGAGADYCCTATEEQLAPHPQSN